ncbi:cupin domain-containing protein [Saccharothrix sp. BKS2]|uniref:cupin domain-containing protein n=1 Tax=Saccharothrix sp. BKS2 TaxID=3064400 RepID=UPI0039E7F511
MDALTELLRGVRAHGALVCRSVATPPWSPAFTAAAPLTLVTAARGEAWLFEVRRGCSPRTAPGSTCDPVASG